MKKYLQVFTVFIAVIALLIWLVPGATGSEEMNFRWAIYLYFILVTLSFHAGYVNTQSKPQVFVRFYMASTTIRLLLHLGVIVIYSMFHKELAVHFIITFMIFYFVFTLFELLFVAKRVKK